MCKQTNEQQENTMTTLLESGRRRIGVRATAAWSPSGFSDRKGHLAKPFSNESDSLNDDEQKRGRRPDESLSLEIFLGGELSAGLSFMSSCSDERSRSKVMVVSESDERDMDTARVKNLRESLKTNDVTIDAGSAINADEKDADPVAQDGQQEQARSKTGQLEIRQRHRDRARSSLSVLHLDKAARVGGPRGPRVSGIRQSIAVAMHTSPSLHHHIGNLQTAPSMAEFKDPFALIAAPGFGNSERSMSRRRANSAKCTTGRRSPRPHSTTRPLTRMSKGEGLTSSIRLGAKSAQLEAEEEERNRLLAALKGSTNVEEPGKVEEPMKVEQPRCLSGPLLKLSGTSFFTERWQLRWFEVRSGYLRWWNSPAEARAGVAPKGTQQLIVGLRMQLRSTTQFSLDAHCGKDKVYVFDTNVSKHALNANISSNGWDLSRLGETPDMHAWMTIINQQTEGASHRGSPRTDTIMSQSRLSAPQAAHARNPRHR
jgi:hypothetical protein